MFVLCIRTVNTLEPNRLHIRNQYDLKVCYWPFIFPKSGEWSSYRNSGYATELFYENFKIYPVLYERGPCPFCL